MQDWRLKVALIKTSVDNDFFGPTLNIRIKDYSWAPLNGLVVGLDLYEILKKRIFFFILLIILRKWRNKDEGTRLLDYQRHCSVFLVKRKTKDIVKYHYYHHHLPFFSEKTSSSGHHRGSVCDNSRDFGHESTQMSSEEEDEKEREENSQVLKSHRDSLLRNVMIIDDGPYALLFFWRHSW